ncbi:MAG: chemotaxis protein CheB [Thermoanaerobaculia bacterium]
MPTHDIVTIGASAGGVETLSRLVAGLPPDFPGALFIVLHIPPEPRSLLPSILSKVGPLQARHAVDGEPIKPGQILVAPPDLHLLLDEGVVRVVHGPHENRHRPAIDPLFRSAALVYGSRVVGVVLSGMLDDGTAGLMEIKRAGGIAITQDPRDALYPGMPTSAMRHVDVDYVLPHTRIPAQLVSLAAERLPAVEPNGRPTTEWEKKMADLDAGPQGDERPGVPSGLTCPDCHGNLWETRDQGLVRYRCRVGHAYSTDSMKAAQDDSVERALWISLRAVEEKAALARRTAEEARSRNLAGVESIYREKAQESTNDALIIREILSRSREPTPES